MIKKAKYVTVKLADLKEDPTNPNEMTAAQRVGLSKSYQKHGDLKPIIIDTENMIIDGHQRLDELRKLGETELVAIQVKPEGLADRIEIRQIMNKLYGQHDKVKDADDLLAVFNENKLDELAEMLGKHVDEFKVALERHHGIDFGFNKTSIGLLADVYMVPPFSVLDTRQGYWQDRKRHWLQLGIESELGREGTLLGMPTNLKHPKYKHLMATGTSIFDPTLCEVVYSWFVKEGGSVLDPFAGGSVRAIVAAMQGLRYTGIELRQDQIDANAAQWRRLQSHWPQRLGPTWIKGDSQKLDQLLDHKTRTFDLLFTCPPYADLERYSRDPADLSNMPYPDFLRAYEKIMQQAASRLASDRFAVLVVANVRGPDGVYRNLVGDTIEICKRQGLKFYNDIVLINAIGTAPIRAQNIFADKRKVVKVHQNVLVFFKGDPGNIARALRLGET